METLDDILRYGAISLLVWLAALVMRDFRDRLAGRLGVASALSCAAYLLATKPGLGLFGVNIDMIFLPFYAASPALAWLFCLSQFDDNFKITTGHWLVVLLKSVTGGCGYLAFETGYQWLFLSLMTISTLIMVGILAHLAYVAWQGRNDDLVETRRQFRTVFVIGVIIISIGILLSESTFRRQEAESIELVLQAAAFLVITVFLLWRLSSPDGEDLFFKAAQIVPNGETTHCDLSVADRHDLDVIVGLENTSLVLEPGMTITRLANELHIPEHRVRHLINQHLGYRNFADFLNHHRVQAAKNRLADTNNRNMPVLTVAMDLGYGSLGPFNRAFKERTGLTPTEFRNRSLEAGMAAAK